MKRTLLLLSLLIGFVSAGVPNTFVANSAAKASEVNDNFTYLDTALNGRIDSVISELGPAFEGVNKTTDSLRQRIQVLENKVTALETPFVVVKNLSNSVIKDGALDEFTVTNLVKGATYRVTISAFFQINKGGFPRIIADAGGATPLMMASLNVSDINNPFAVIVEKSAVFTATSTPLTFSAAGLTENAFIVAADQQAGTPMTYVIVERLGN